MNLALSIAVYASLVRPAGLRGALRRHDPGRRHRAGHAEDASQTTFLALARKVGTIRDRRMLASWLQEVAFRTALRARARATRDRAIDRRSAAMSASGNASADPDEPLSSRELRPVLYEEFNDLPEKYGVAVILGYLEGKSNCEVADLLQWPVGTVKGRPSRLRDMLRARLSRRGLDPDDVRF